MKYFPLVLANLGRHKRRTILTISSVALALFLFASLQTVTTTIAAASRFGSARRLVSMNATGFVLPLPIAYANRLQAVPGVEQVTWANWFGGKYGDGKRFFAAFAVDAKSSQEVLTLLQRLNDEFRKTIVIVTHDAHAAERAKTVLHLEKGDLIRGGAAAAGGSMPAAGAPAATSGVR